MRWNYKFKGLSTPHGALGTVEYYNPLKELSNAFNSTRCIRNGVSNWWDDPELRETFNSTRCIRNLVVYQERDGVMFTFNSTRCIRNLIGYKRTKTLGEVSFNSTRCIRNKSMHTQTTKKSELLSTPHGALGTWWRDNQGQLSAFNFQLHTVH